MGDDPLPAWDELFADVLLLGDYQIVCRDRRTIELSERETIILATLAQARGRWKSKQTLAADIYRGRPGWTDSWATIVRQSIAGAREKCQGCSFGIESDHRSRDLGYRLSGHPRVLP